MGAPACRQASVPAGRAFGFIFFWQKSAIKKNKIAKKGCRLNPSRKNFSALEHNSQLFITFAH